MNAVPAQTPAPAAPRPLIDGAAAPERDAAALQGDGSQLRPRLIPGSDADGGEMPAGPQEEADLAQTVNKALLMIHGRKSRDSVIKQLHDPSMTIAEAVGRAAFNILMTISDQKSVTNREPLSETILQEAAGYVVPELMTIGCVAGIFPFEPPDDSQEEVGGGETEFDRQCQLAILEATRIYGEKVLQGPEGERRSTEAQDDWARGVHEEVQNGTADPEFMQAVGQAGGTGAPPAAAPGAEGTEQA